MAGQRTALVLTASDGVTAGVREDVSGDRVGDRLESLGFTVERVVVADDRAILEAALSLGADRHPLVVTTGGTGLTPRDVTPQATRAVVDYEIPGMAESMRAAGRAVTPLADLSRSIVGVRGRTLIVNLPGSPKGALESLEAIVPILDHALETLAGPHEHGEAGAVMFETFEHVPAYPLVLPVFWGAFALFLFVIVRRLRVFTAVHEGTPVPASEVGIRAWGVVRYAILQNKMFRWTRAGAVHYVMFLGSTILLIGNINIVTGGIPQAIVSWPAGWHPVDPRRRHAEHHRRRRLR